MGNDKFALRKVPNALTRVLLACIVCTMMIAVLTGLTKVSNVVIINNNGKVASRYTTSTTLEDILTEANIVLGSNDVCEFTDFVDGKAEIKLSKEYDVALTVDATTTHHVSNGGTVADVLAQSGTVLSEHDTLNVPADQKITADTPITITRVRFEEYQKTQEIPFMPAVHTAANDQIVTITTPGVVGQKLTTFRRKFVDGVQTEDIVVADVVTVAPIAETVTVEDAAKPLPPIAPPVTETLVVSPPPASSNNYTPAPPVVGTPAPEATTTEYYVGGELVYCAAGSAPVELDSNGNPVRYSSIVTGKATAYSNFGRPTQLVPGCVAMDLSRFPKGTQLYIKAADGSYVYGYSRVADTGEFVSNGSGVLADLFFNTYEESCQFGAKQVNIFVLN